MLGNPSGCVSGGRSGATVIVVVIPEIYPWDLIVIATG